ncbi:MAG: glycosyltransferase family 4 protein [Bacteroidetes bacterium]|nr:glycosyltransferase family 4 protein [Bacteroidota bacterium]
MIKKKVLIFIDWYSPGYKAGGPIQSVLNLVAHLNDYFEFSVITRDTDYCETTPYSTIKSNEWNLLPDGTKVYYFSSDRLTRSNIGKLIRSTDFDIVYLNGIFSLYFTLIPLMFLRKTRAKKVIIAARGMFAESALGVKKIKKKFFLRSVKVLRLFEDVVFHASTENEKSDIRKVLGEKVNIRTAGNLPQKIQAAILPDRMKEKGLLKLINIARIAPEKNILFALKIFKKVKGNVSFDFYGPVYDKIYWDECRKVISELPPNVTVNYKGSIESHKVMAEFKNYHFMFMPTLGENFGHIILQSLSSGCPVIISNQTPWKSLHNRKAGWDIPLNEENHFVRVIDECIQMDQDDYNQMSQAAFTFAKEYIDDKEIIEQNKHLFFV